MRCVRPKARMRNIALRRSTCRSHCHTLLRPRRFSTDRRHVSQYQLEESLRAERGFPEKVVHVELRPPACLEPRPHLVEVGGPGEWRQDRKSGLEQPVPLDESPQPLEVGLAPCRIDHEVPGDAVPQRPRDFDTLQGVIDGRVLDETGQAFVSGGFEAEKDVEVPRDRAPGLQQIRMTRDEIDSALDQDPPFADPRRRSSMARARLRAGWYQKDRLRRRSRLRSSRNPGRPIRSTVPARISNGVARSSRTSSGTGTLAPSRLATSDDGQGTRTDDASHRRVAGRGAERRPGRRRPDSPRSA